MYVKFSNGKIWSVEGNYLTAIVEISLADIIDQNLDEFLDTIAEEAVGDIRLMDISYEAIGGGDDTVRLQVGGDVSEILNDADGDDVGIIESPDVAFSALAKHFAWSVAELAHARATATVSYRDECVIPLANGRELHCPAAPGSCDYVRVVEAGYELMYWSADEWGSDPADVMGAILGLAHAAGASSGTAARVAVLRTRAIMVRNV